MSDETQGNPLFSNFVPPKETTMAFTEAPEAPVKRPRKPRAVKAAPAPKEPKAKRKPKPPKQPVAPEQVARPRAGDDRYHRGDDLQTILRAAVGLKDEDYATFEPLLNTFNAMSKVQRERIMGAIGKVFIER